MYRFDGSARLRFLLAGILAVSAIAVALPRAARAADWPQAHSDVPADPAVKFGTLPNGMRYAIMRNTTPKGAVSMRLGIEAGSLEESDAQQGLAHFLEHMAFRGSRHVPEAESWPGLQRLGMGVGADVNASTAWTQTLYQFNLPRNDATTVDTGLMRLREIASELTLDQRAMDDERGVILSEERLRDTADFHRMKAVLGLAAPDSLAVKRYPIGLTDIIKKAPVTLIRDFYQAYYRPERATLIVVGDVDPKTMEAKIVAKFGDWKPVGPAGSDPAQAPPAPRQPEAALLVAPGSAMIYLEWVSPQKPDTKARERAELIQLVGMQILSYRLQDLASGPQHPFAETRVGHDRLFHTTNLDMATLLIRPQDWTIALNAGITAVRRLEKFGVTAGEMKRASEEILAQLQNAAAQAKTRPSPQIADLIANSVDEGEVFTGPIEDLAAGTTILKDLTVEAVNAGVRTLMNDHGPLALVASPVPIAGDKAAVSAALAAAEKAPLTAETARASVVWPYTSFGAPGTVVERKSIADFDTTFLRFANGVRLSVKPTKFATGEVVVDVRVGNGRQGLSPDKDTPRWAIGRGFIQGGMKAISYQDMNRVLAGKVFQAQASMGDDGLVFWGRTRTADLLTQMQVVAGYITAPGWRADAFDRARTSAIDELAEAGGTPSGVLSLNIAGLLHNGDRRWMAPAPAELAAAQPQALEALLAPTLAASPIEVTMAGDITVDAAIQAVATTLGALPNRAAPVAPSPASLAVHFPPATATPVVLHHTGRADQGIAAIAWPTPDAFDMDARADLRVLKSVLDTRIMDQLRVRDGATYSPDTRLGASHIFPGYGYLMAASELPSAKMPLFFSVMASITADLAAKPISADELERARKPTVESIITDRQTNDYWADALIGAQADPRLLEALRHTLPNLQRVDAAAIQHVAATYLTAAKAWKLEITPKSVPAAATHP
ncbi:MAG TPA: insulinase family protein [Stellaceae bacterium]